ncbi:MAG: hypothetical protein QGH70_02265 [Nitrospinota bacterium]|jgi:hypothetical protein|nr:hypothetical protein [Nitrospinota bacterium]MDP6482655.1 hypothetical protein [Nitrospinota bacterium]MDP6617974.1 hypothetical protein [Nitrospinota bacterium]
MSSVRSDSRSRSRSGRSSLFGRKRVKSGDGRRGRRESGGNRLVYLMVIVLVTVFIAAYLAG